jgi:hypothetical protein
MQGLPYDIIKHNDRAADYLETFSKEEIKALHIWLVDKLMKLDYTIIGPDEKMPEKPAKKGKKAKSKKQ